MTDDPKIRRLMEQLDDVLTEANRKAYIEEMSGMDTRILHLLGTAQQHALGRFELGLILMMISLGYGFHMIGKEEIDRTVTDEQIADLATTMTLSDLEAFFSYMGIMMWKELWERK